MPAPAASALVANLAAALEMLPIAIVATAPAGKIEYTNPHFRRLVGVSEQQAIGRDLAQFRASATPRLRVDRRSALIAGEPWQGESTLAVVGGRCHVLESAYPVQDEAGRVVRVLHFFHELSSLSEAAELGRFAFYDVLTALPNRNLFEERLIAAVASSRRTRKALAVVHTDVENFDCVNIVLDRQAGDQLLRLIARRLQHTLRASDSVARLGGDELAILLPDVESSDEALRTAEKLRRACSGWYEASGREYSVSLSVGVSFLANDDTARDLMTRAEAAMYRDKAARRDGYYLQARFVGTRYPLDSA